MKPVSCIGEDEGGGKTAFVRNSDNEQLKHPLAVWSQTLHYQMSRTPAAVGDNLTNIRLVTLDHIMHPENKW